MFSKITFAAALALAVSGLAGTAHAYDAFGGGSEHDMVIRQAAQSPAVAGVTKASDWSTVGTNAWNGDRVGLNASAGFAKHTVATNAR